MTTKEPGIRTYKLNTIEKTSQEHLVSQDYIFFAPFPRNTKGQQYLWIGPHILDSQGVSLRHSKATVVANINTPGKNLVWWGNSSTSSRTQNLQPCAYLSEQKDHLCWSEATWTNLDHVNGTNHVLDNTYTPVTEPFGALGTLRFPNPHEVKTTASGKTLLNCVYDLKKVDLTPYNGDVEGYVEDGCFQEIDIASREVIFEWCGTDSLELWHSYIFLDIPANVVNKTGEPYGKGTLLKPWDYFHIVRDYV